MPYQATRALSRACACVRSVSAGEESTGGTSNAQSARRVVARRGCKRPILIPSGMPRKRHCTLWSGKRRVSIRCITATFGRATVGKWAMGLKTGCTHSCAPPVSRSGLSPPFCCTVSRACDRSTSQSKSTRLIVVPGWWAPERAQRLARLPAQPPVPHRLGSRKRHNRSGRPARSAVGIRTGHWPRHIGGGTIEATDGSSLP
jgi:hypothetical protein